jgi:hypothetical protein
LPKQQEIKSFLSTKRDINGIYKTRISPGIPIDGIYYYFYYIHNLKTYENYEIQYVTGKIGREKVNYQFPKNEIRSTKVYAFGRLGGVSASGKELGDATLKYLQKNLEKIDVILYVGIFGDYTSSLEFVAKEDMPLPTNIIKPGLIGDIKVMASQWISKLTNIAQQIPFMVIISYINI